MPGIAACPWAWNGQSAADQGRSHESAKSSKNDVWLNQVWNASFGHGRQCSMMLRQATEARAPTGRDCEIASAFLMHAEKYASQQSTPCVRSLL